MPHSYAGHDSLCTADGFKCAEANMYACMAWLIRDMTHSFWDMTHSYERHGSFLRETWLIPTRDMTHSVRRWFQVRRGKYVYIHSVTPSYLRPDSFLCETWLILTWHMTHSYVTHDSFLRGTLLILCVYSFCVSDGFKCAEANIYTHIARLLLIWDMTHPYVRHDSFLRETRLIPTRDMTHCVPLMVSKEQMQLYIHT